MSQQHLTPYKLFTYASETLSYIKAGILDEETGMKTLKSALKHCVNNFVDSPSSYSLQMPQEDIPDWIKLIYTTPKRVSKSLSFYMNSWSAHDSHFLNALIDKFFEFADKERLAFYEDNFTKYVEYKGQQHVLVCGGSHEELADNIFHNLPSLYILKANNSCDYQDTKLQKIINDIKNLRQLNNEQFIDIYGPSIVFALSIKGVSDAKEDLLLSSKPQLQQIFASKMLHQKKLQYGKFHKYVEDGILPLNIKFPKGRYVMSQYIMENLNTVDSCIRFNDVRKERFIEVVKSCNIHLNLFANKYDLSFLDINKIMKHFEPIDKWESSNHFNRKDPEVSKVLLELKMNLNFLFNHVEKVEQSRLKL